MIALYKNIYMNLKINQKYYVYAIFFLKIFIGLYYFSSPAENWYVPFMESITNSLLENSGNPFKYEVSSNIAFPYGYGLILTLLPSFLLSYFLHFDPIIAYFITLAFIDLLIFIFIKKITTTEQLNVFIFYWCNPIVILCTYYLGLNDIIPVLFVVMAVYFVKHSKILPTALCISIAISCKMSMVSSFTNTNNILSS
jgi:hypothetical protein